MKYPRIYLVADNCFAIKRWVDPMEWAKKIKDIGLKYIETSTDNECDPLYNTEEYLKKWVKNVKVSEEKTGTKVVNFYTGYQTYRTIGLAHPDKRVSKRLLESWLKKMVKVAKSLNSGLGFYLHAVPENALQSPEAFNKTHEQVLENLSELAAYAWENGKVQISLEQMYSPQQTPWTIKGAKEFIKEIYRRTEKPFYITIDVGHQIGQRKFLRPEFEDIKKAISEFKQGGKIENIWLGPLSAYNIFEKALKSDIIHLEGYIKEIEFKMDKYPYMFAEYKDGDTGLKN
jgi:sugar phosphate isomerase/epimerase